MGGVEECLFLFLSSRTLSLSPSLFISICVYLLSGHFLVFVLYHFFPPFCIFIALFPMLSSYSPFLPPSFSLSPSHSHSSLPFSPSLSLSLSVCLLLSLSFPPF